MQNKIHSLLLEDLVPVSIHSLLKICNLFFRRFEPPCLQRFTGVTDLKAVFLDATTNLSSSILNVAFLSQSS